MQIASLGDDALKCRAYSFDYTKWKNKSKIKSKKKGEKSLITHTMMIFSFDFRFGAVSVVQLIGTKVFLAPSLRRLFAVESGESCSGLRGMKKLLQRRDIIENGGALDPAEHGQAARRIPSRWLMRVETSKLSAHFPPMVVKAWYQTSAEATIILMASKLLWLTSS
jgi:hypothetical protein